jgi:hypothetical protein
MSFYDEASWVLIPEGIKEDVVYAQKPTDGLGDLTFTRASDATRTNSAGVIERTPWNLFTQSVWTGGGLNVAPTGWSQGQSSGNFEPQTAINGNVPYRFYGTVARRYLAQVVTLNAGQDFLVTSFVDSVTISAPISNIISTTASISNLKYYVNSVEVVSSTPITANTTIAISFTATVSASGSIRIGGGASGSATYDFVISQPQISEGTDAKPYFATTNRQDVPRLDYRNADGSLSTCPRLLLEPQRTNSIRNSTMVGAVAGSPGTLPTNWGAVGNGITFSVIGTGTENGLSYIDISAVGTATATNARIGFELSTQISAATGQNWTNSFYFKKLSETSAPTQYQLANSENTDVGGIVAITSLAFTPTTNLERYSYSNLTAGGATVARIQPFIRFSLTIGATYDFTIRIAAPQMELGATATTFIPTTTAAVTRLADTASKTGISSLIGQTEGTLFFEFTGPPQNNVYYSLSPGGLSNTILVGINSSGLLNASIFAPFPTAAINVGNFSYVPGQNYKVAFAYNSTQCVLAVNGSLQTTGGFAGFPAGTLSRIGIDNSSGSGVIIGTHNQAALFPTRLTNAQLAQLTTL